MHLRALLLFLCFFVGSLWYLWEARPVWVEPAAVVVRDFVERKQVAFAGLDLLDGQELQAELPWDKPVWWWLWNNSQVVSKLRINPFVSQVELRQCEPFRWGCFIVQVQERRPELVALVGEKVWLVGQDGGYLAPLPLQRAGVKMLRDEGLWKIADIQLPIVEGVSGSDASPEATKVRYQFVSKVIRTFEEEGDFPIERVLLESNGELRVRLRGHDFWVHCDVPRDNFDVLREEVRRLQALLAEFKGDYSRLDSIDLAFKKVGVVKLKEAQS